MNDEFVGLRISRPIGVRDVILTPEHERSGSCRGDDFASRKDSIDELASNNNY